MCVQLVTTCSGQLEGAQGHCGEAKAGVRPAHAVDTPYGLSQAAHSPAAGCWLRLSHLATERACWVRGEASKS